MSNTKFGFDFGSISVERVYGDKDVPHLIKIKTPKAEFTVRATKTGQIRLFSSAGHECELVDKDYMSQLEGFANINRKEQ